MRMSSAYWAEKTGILVFDPDGWDRTNFQASWAEPITLAEFIDRAGRSTVDLRTWDLWVQFADAVHSLPF